VGRAFDVAPHILMKRGLQLTFVAICVVGIFVWLICVVGINALLPHIEIGLAVGFIGLFVEYSKRAKVNTGRSRLVSSAAPNGPEPIKLKHCLQGGPPPGPNAFRWQGGQLTYMLPNRSLKRSDWDKMVTPTAAQWEEFWRVCDEIDVWSWPPSLGDVRVFDGLSWETELEVGSRRVVSRGQVWGSPPDFEPKLMRLHEALQALTGWQLKECRGKKAE